MNLNNLKIGQKLAAAFALVVAAIVVMGVVVFLNVRAVDNARIANNESVRSIELVQQAQFYLGRQENSFRGFLISGDAYYM